MSNSIFESGLITKVSRNPSAPSKLPVELMSRLCITLFLLTEEVSKRFSFELVLSNFLNLFCNCKEHVDLRNAGGGGIKRGLLGRGIDSVTQTRNEARLRLS